MRLELRLECVERAAESDEHQARARAFGPRHRPTQHERIRIEALLCRALHVRRRRRIVDLIVVVAAPADAQVLLVAAHRVEPVEIVQPLLHRDEARAVEAGARLAGCRSVEGPGASWILGAVLVAREVASLAVAERVDHRLESIRRADHHFDRARAVNELAPVLATEPAPERTVRRRALESLAGAGGKIAQTPHVYSECERRRTADADHRLHRVNQLSQPAQRRARSGLGHQAERQVARKRRHSGEDSGLDWFHGHASSGRCGVRRTGARGARATPRLLCAAPSGRAARAPRTASSPTRPWSAATRPALPAAAGGTSPARAA